MAKPKELEGYWDRYAAETAAYWERVRKEKAIAQAKPHIFPWAPVPVFADLMLFLILHGGKRSTAHLMLQHEIEGTKPHAVGEHSVVLDGFGRPGCVIRTASVEIKPFKAVDAAFCRAESEGGGDVLYWKQGHWAYFESYCKIHGRTMSEDTPMVFEYFTLIHPGGDGG
jgi:uncharacterized protein YhfF